ncbi:hypothetical protein [Paraburkholderia sp. SG-MS1]|uniref:hypothetical protein n=1 Tax=Paraburkholderia sp. SG-MS1 TaxID=2023741 RepID=UPI00406D4F78
MKRATRLATGHLASGIYPASCVIRCQALWFVWRASGARLWALWLRMTERVRPAHDPAQMRTAINGLNLSRADFVDKLLRPRARHAHAPVQFIVPARDRYV